MFDVKNDLKALVPRQTRHCVWIRQHEGENGRLVQIWIDPEMSGFETHTTEPEHVLASAEADSQELDGDSDGPYAKPGRREEEEGDKWRGLRPAPASLTRPRPSLNCKPGLRHLITLTQYAGSNSKTGRHLNRGERGAALPLRCNNLLM